MLQHLNKNRKYKENPNKKSKEAVFEKLKMCVHFIF